MTTAQVTQIQELTVQAVKDVVKAQIAKGAPSKGISKTRHAAIVADVVTEILASYPTQIGDESKWQRLVMRAVFSGSLLNASQLRQQLEKAGILSKEGTMSGEYGVTDRKPDFQGDRIREGFKLTDRKPDFQGELIGNRIFRGIGSGRGLTDAAVFAGWDDRSIPSVIMGVWSTGSE